MLISINAKKFPPIILETRLLCSCSPGTPLCPALPMPGGWGVFWVSISEWELLWLRPLSHLYSCQLQKPPPQMGMRLLLLLTEFQAHMGNLNPHILSKQQQKGNKLWKPIYYRHKFLLWVTGILITSKIVGIFTYCSIKKKMRVKLLKLF